MVTRVQRCAKKFGGMDRWFGVVICVLMIISGLQAQSPCPGIFDYHNDGGGISGLVRVPPSGQTNSIVTKISFSIATRLPSSYVGRLVPIDPERGLQRYNQGAPLEYQVHFPVTSPLPHLTSLTVNGQQLCYGPEDVPGPNQYVSTITLQHNLYLRGGSSPNSLFSQYDRPAVYDKPAQSYNNDGSQVFFINDVSDNKQQSPVQQYEPDDSSYNRPPPRPTFQQYQPRPKPDRQPDYQYQYATQPPQPEPDYSQYGSQPPEPEPNYSQFSKPMPPRRPDYNQYPTQQQPPRRPPTQPPPPPPEPEMEPDRSFPRPATPAPPPPSQVSAQVECGMVAGGNDKVPLIMNGQGYERGEWPWLVAVYKRKDGSLTFICGGTLISNRHIVTAAHCMQVRTSLTSKSDIVVKVGVHNLEDWGDDGTVTRTLESAHIHEQYNSTSLANDILVFTLDRRVEYTTNIRPVCLWDGKPDLNRIVGASGVVAGWGKTEIGPAGHGEPRMVRLPIVSTSTCRASKPDFHKLTSDTTLCAGDRNGMGPCLGDSGGGLYVLDGGRWRLRGVVSLSLQPASGEKTCDLDQYVIFTDAAKYVRWIRNIVQSSQI